MKVKRMKVTGIVFLILILTFGMLTVLVSFVGYQETIKNNVFDSVPMSELVSRIEEQDNPSQRIRDILDIAVDTENSLKSVTSALVSSVGVMRVSGIMSILTAMISLYLLSRKSHLP